MGLTWKPYGKGKPITHVAVERDKVSVRFKGGKEYTFTYKSAGMQAVKMMQRLAVEKRGLTTFINQKRPKHASQE